MWFIAAIGMALVVSVWQKAELVDQADQYFREVYLYSPKARYSDIVDQYEQDGDGAASANALIDLLMDLDHVQKGDEVASEKRISYAQLIRTLIRLEELEMAKFWVDQWLAFDDRDINGLLIKARLLVIKPETRNEGEYQLGLLTAQFPHSLVVADGRATAWASTGELGRAFLEYVPFLQPGLQRHYFGKMIEQSSYVLKAGSSESLEIKVAAGYPAIVRITAPSEVQITTNQPGPESSGFLYEKDIGQPLELKLSAPPDAEDLNIMLKVTIRPPEMFRRLVEPRFHSLMAEQLNTLGTEEARQRYLDYVETNQ